MSMKEIRLCCNYSQGKDASEESCIGHYCGGDFKE